MSINNSDLSGVYAMLEEIKAKLDKRPELVSPENSTSADNATEIHKIAETLREVVETARQPQKHIHKHTIDLMSNKVLIVLPVVMVVVVVLSWVVSNQRDTIGQFRDNDLKYAI